MAEEQNGYERFTDALDIVRRGNFDEIKEAFEGLGFKFVQGRDPNHWTYYHPQLRNDRHFAYPRNFYRPHGSKRSSDRISRHDQSQARQMVEALRAILGATEDKGEVTNERRDA